MARFKSGEQQLSSAQKLRAVVKTCRDQMRKDKGLNGDLDRLPQLTWLMFLKFVDDMEAADEAKAILSGNKHVPLLASPYRWRDWVLGENSLTGSELIAFLNNDECRLPDGHRGPGLFAYLRNLQATDTRDRRVVVSRIFSGIDNRMTNGYIIRDVALKLSELNFSSSTEVHTLSALYEGMLREMRDAAGDSGEFYTPRPLVELMVKLTNPQLGEVVLDPACGTGGFLAAAYEHMSTQVKTADDSRRLQDESIFGWEPKTLPFMLAEMNLLLHGLESPKILPKNSLATRLTDIGDAERVDVILTNPPFGGEEEAAIRSNFPANLQTSETALLFLQLIMRLMRRPRSTLTQGGRAAVVVPNGTLFGDGVAARIKEQLLKEFNLHTVLRLPKGVFSPYTDIPSNVLFFDRSGPTKEIWFYQHLPPEGRSQYVKTRALAFEEFSGLVKWWQDREVNANAWLVPVSDVLRYSDDGTLRSCNLAVKNPAVQNSEEERSSADIISDLKVRHDQIGDLISQLLAEVSNEHA